MDHLRSSVGMRGYVQVGPKVVYKREGMSTFDLTWKGIDERLTDIVSRQEGGASRRGAGSGRGD